MRKSNVLFSVGLIIFMSAILFNIDKITNYTAKFLKPTPNVVLAPPNEYAYNNDYIYVQKTDSFIPYSKQDIMNIFYTGLDNGYETITLYCPSEYTSCLDDVLKITDDRTLITDIGNFVHPYNNFHGFDRIYNSLGEVSLMIVKMYSDEMIDALNKKMDDIALEIFKDGMTIEEKILSAHDYIIDNTVYKKEDTYHSGDAYGTLIEGASKCSGYADAMALFLDKLGLKNYKVASDNHVWNAVYLFGEWVQLDLTWDDPPIEDGASESTINSMRHKFYMIDTPTLESYNTGEHEFDKSVYIEVR